MNTKILEILSLVKRANNTKNKEEKQVLNEEILSNIDENMFVKALKSSIGIKTVATTPEEDTVYNSIRFGLDEDNGYLLPHDMKNNVESLRKEGLSLEILVKVEPVESMEGQRVYDLSADITPLETVEQFQDIPYVDQSKVKGVKFKTKKKAGILKATLELVSDSEKVFKEWLKKWCAKKSRATRNQMIVDKINEMTLETKIEVANIDTLENDILTNLADQYKNNATVLINYAGYEYLSNLKDTEGNLIKLFESSSENTKDKLLFGLYPVMILPDNLFKNEEGKISIVIGSLNEAVVLFDRGKMLIDINKNIGFYEDDVLIKLVEKLDVEEVDTDAVIKLVLIK